MKIFQRNQPLPQIFYGLEKPSNNSDENKISRPDKIEIKVTVKNGKPKTNYELRYDPAVRRSERRGRKKMPRDFYCSRHKTLW
jgi:hypothetical protein